MTVKRCSKCGAEKPRDQFGKNSAAKDGLFSYCRPCARAYNKKYYEANADKERQRARDWRIENPDKASDVARRHRKKNLDKVYARTAEWRTQNREYLKEIYRRRYADNKDEEAARFRKYYLENRERLLSRKSEWVAQNPDAAAESWRAWKRKNPDRVRANNAIRRATHLSRVRPFDDELFDLASVEAYALARARVKATGARWHVDHIVPLRSPMIQGLDLGSPISPKKFVGPLFPVVCGLHNEFNLAVITARENMSKGNRYWPGMP